MKLYILSKLNPSLENSRKKKQLIWQKI